MRDNAAADIESADARWHLHSQTDLARLLNSRSRASEVMTGSLQRLSLRMIRRLHDEWHIPADILIRDAA